MNRGNGFVLCLTPLVISTASAETYWLRYEGNDFPENQGWTHSWNEPNAVRWIDNGTLVIDASEERSTCDGYEGTFDFVCRPYPDAEFPEPGSQFFVRWRLKIEDFTGPTPGTGVGVYVEDGWGASFGMTDHSVRSSFEAGLTAQYEPGVFHEFELRSADMRTYELYIDGALGLSGNFYETPSSNTVIWGEKTTSSASLTRWDYLRIGIAPEPSALAAMFALLACRGVSRRRD